MKANFIERVRQLVHDPAFEKPYPRPVDYSKRGQIILVTKIKPQSTSIV